HSFPWREFVECAIDPRAQLPPHQIALWIRSCAPIGNLIEQAVLFARRVGRNRSVFFSDLPFAQVIKAEVGNDAVDPGVEGALEAEAAYVLVGLQESILENVLRVVLRPGQVQSQTQHCLIVMANEFLEGCAIPALRLADQHRVVDAASLPCHGGPCGGVLGSATLVPTRGSCARVRTLANRNWYRPRIGRHVCSSILSKPALKSLFRPAQ